jgi:hypothetical protein
MADAFYLVALPHYPTTQETHPRPRLSHCGVFCFLACRDVFFAHSPAWGAGQRHARYTPSSDTGRTHRRPRVSQRGALWTTVDPTVVCRGAKLTFAKLGEL